MNTQLEAQETLCQTVERWPLNRLIEYAGNPRKNDHAVAQTATAIRTFGFRVPILARSFGEIVDGHLPLKAARRLGMQTVPVLLADDMSEQQVRAFRISVNKVADLAERDTDLLAAELRRLRVDEFPLDSIGFSDAELAGLLDTLVGETDADVIPPLQQREIAQAGEVWLLGRHRLVCGDATDPLVVAKALNGVKPHLMVTDPPYGVEYDASWRARAGVNKSVQKMGKVANDDRADWRAAWILFPGDVPYVWHAGRYASSVQASLEACAFEIRCQIIWAKDRFALGRGDYHWQHEPCWYSVRQGKVGHWAADRKQTTVWNINAARMAATATARKSRSSACGARSRTTAVRVRRSTIRSRAPGPRSLPPR